MEPQFDQRNDDQDNEKHNDTNTSREQGIGSVAVDKYGEAISDHNAEETPNFGQGILADRTNSSIRDFDPSGDEMQSFSTEFGAIEKRFGADSLAHIKSELSRIDAIKNETLGALESRGQLSAESRKLMHSLSLSGVNAYNLTPEETKLVYDYVTNATPEIERQKVDRVFDIFYEHVNSPSSRRDGLEPAFFNPEEADRKLELLDRYRDYDRGKLDLSRGFDAEKALKKLIDSGEYEDSWYLRRRLEEDDIDELMEDGLVDGDSLYAYGPFTYDDIVDMKSYLDTTWTDALRPRYKGKSLSAILGDTVKCSYGDIDNQLAYDFIAREILQNRRLKSKDMLISASSVMLEICDLEEPEGKEKKEIYNSAKRSCSWMAYFAAELLGYSKEELKKRYNSKRPFDKEFFEEIVSATKQLTEQRSKYLDEYFKPSLTKMDEHLHNVQTCLIDLELDEAAIEEEFD